MLALVKKPRIEISLQGEKVDELIEWISKKFEVSILTSDDSEQKSSKSKLKEFLSAKRSLEELFK